MRISKTERYSVECAELTPEEEATMNKVVTEGSIEALKKWAEEHPELEIKITKEEIKGDFTKEYLSNSMAYFETGVEFEEPHNVAEGDIYLLQLMDTISTYNRAFALLFEHNEQKAALPYIRMQIVNLVYLYAESLYPKRVLPQLLHKQKSFNKIPIKGKNLSVSKLLNELEEQYQGIVALYEHYNHFIHFSRVGYETRTIPIQESSMVSDSGLKELEKEVVNVTPYKMGSETFYLAKYPKPTQQEVDEGFYNDICFVNQAIAEVVRKIKGC